MFQTKDFWLNYSASAMLRYNTNSWSSWFIRDADCRFISKLTTWTPLPEYKWLLRDIKASSSHLFWFYRNLEETALWKIQGFDTWTGFCCTWCLNSHLNTTLWQSYVTSIKVHKWCWKSSQNQTVKPTLQIVARGLKDCEEGEGVIWSLLDLCGWSFRMQWALCWWRRS